jgi:hypothetical protein
LFMRTTPALLSLTVILFAATAQLNAQATRTWVSGVGDDANPCSRTAPCKTFAGAISKTAAGGEIDALDPGGFGALTITKSIMIEGGPGVAGVLVSGTNGITVAAGATDTVVLKNLDFDGIAGLGTNGIRFSSGQKLVVENCHIWGFGHRGISVESNTAGAQAFILNTVLVGQTNNGIVVNPPGVTNTVVLEHVQVVDSTATGLALNPGSTVHVTNSDFSHNGGAGVAAIGAAGPGGFADVTLDSTLISDNGVGLALIGGGAARLSNVNVVGNALGFDTAGGTLNSFGNNHTTGNGGAQPTVDNHLSPL